MNIGSVCTITINISTFTLYIQCKYNLYVGECTIKNIYASMAHLKVKKKTIMQLALETWMHEILNMLSKI